MWQNGKCHILERNGGTMEQFQIISIIRLYQRSDLLRIKLGIISVVDTIFLDLPGLDLHLVPTRRKNTPYLDVVKKINPEIVFIPHHGDLHSDHTSCADSCMVALRPMNVPRLKALYAYETLSESEWNTPDSAHAFIPNVWSDITETLDIKLRAMKCYTSQLKQFPHPRSIEAIESLAKVRGSTVCMEQAEAFVLLRGVICI